MQFLLFAKYTENSWFGVDFGKKQFNFLVQQLNQIINSSHNPAIWTPT